MEFKKKNLSHEDQHASEKILEIGHLSMFSRSIWMEEFLVIFGLNVVYTQLFSVNTSC